MKPLVWKYANNDSMKDKYWFVKNIDLWFNNETRITVDSGRIELSSSHEFYVKFRIQIIYNSTYKNPLLTSNLIHICGIQKRPRSFYSGWTFISLKGFRFHLLYLILIRVLYISKRILFEKNTITYLSTKI